ncbi:MAG: hypothetical protein KC708_21480, partial [Anaerolineae bacterium]|nr:hypothetical protein [Anaerolineae bacterium]
MNHTNKIILVVIILLGLATTTLAQTDAEVITPDNAGQLQLVYELDVPGLSYGNVRLSSDGSLLAASTDTKVTIWDLANQSSMGSYPVSYENELIGFTPDNRYFVYTDFVYTDEATIYLWDVTSGDLHSFDLEDGTDKIMILSFAISPD